MGKKRDLANAHIEMLIDEYVDTVEMYKRSNCIKHVPIMGCSGNLLCGHTDCDSCKQQFYEAIKTKLKTKYIVK
jgi:hypothetical protein